MVLSDDWLRLVEGKAMDPIFQKRVVQLDPKYRELIRMSPVTVYTAPNPSPKGGVYLFSENGTPLYVGRTRKPIAQRLREHVSVSAPDCPFAFRLAREATGRTRASYRPEGSRKKLRADAEFKAAYDKAKDRIRQMEVRYVAEPDPVNQALLEIYVAEVTRARYNDFGTS